MPKNSQTAEKEQTVIDLPHWIDVRDRLPLEEKIAYVIICDASGEVMEAAWYEGQWFIAEDYHGLKDGDLTEVYLKENVTHWMAFPPPIRTPR